MEEANLPIRREHLRHVDSNVENGYHFGLELLNSSEPPTAFFTMNNRLTLGILQALRELSIPCPERVSVLGFDDSDWAAVFNPAVTTIAQPSDEIGRRAVQLVMQYVRFEQQGGEMDANKIVLKSSLRIRGSTGAVAL